MFLLYRIAFFFLFCCSLCGVEDVYLKTPNISRQDIIGTTVGIRPYRQTGVRLEAEQFQNKLVIHNYGYGGSGLTLAFGGSNEALKILQNQNYPSKVVAVLGAGVVGLAAAYDLLEIGYEVHLYSEKWNPNLTSNVAAGSWTPHPLFEDAPLEKKQLHQRLLEVAEQRLSRSANDYPEFAGVKLMPYYILTAHDSTNAVQTSEEVLIHFDNGICKSSRKKYRLGIDGKVFMEDLFAKVKAKGAILEQRHFGSLEDLLNLKEPIIVNCMSLGAREVFDDREFMPVRGQIIHLKPQADIDYMLYQSLPESNYFFHIYPWGDRIILGGVYEHGEEELQINPAAIEQIIRNAEKCLSVDIPDSASTL